MYKRQGERRPGLEKKMTSSAQVEVPQTRKEAAHSDIATNRIMAGEQQRVQLIRLSSRKSCPQGNRNANESKRKR